MTLSLWNGDPGGINFMDSEAKRPFIARMSVTFDTVEKVYLRFLRAIILIIATIMILYAAWLGLSGLYKVMRSPTSIVEEPVTVSAQDLITHQGSAADKVQPSEKADEIDPKTRKFYADFTSRYYGLFRSGFEPYRQSDDKILSKEEFDDAFLRTDLRLNAIKKGELDFVEDKSDLDLLITVMSEAASSPSTKSQLQKYKSAKKVEVSRKVQKTRSETRRGWDSYSMSCASWYLEPIGCATNRTVEVPYTETVKSMQFPQGTLSHSQIFRSFQDRFFALLKERRTKAANNAESAREAILIGQHEGKSALLLALQIGGGFLTLMFFFLLIAIERHQRRFSQSALTPTCPENDEKFIRQPPLSGA